jgi:hypothetical protein
MNDPLKELPPVALSPSERGMVERAALADFRRHSKDLPMWVISLERYAFQTASVGMLGWAVLQVFVRAS